jgi:pilus assembly protein FimV
MRITYPALVASALLSLAVQPSMAVGFGKVVNATTLGQPLDVTVPVSADPNEQITASCVAAEVMAGDNPLPSAVLQWRLDPSPDSSVQWLRIRSSVRMVEPVLHVTVSAGCSSRVSRQFVVFVDPPLPAYQTSVPTAIEPVATAASAAAPGGSALGAGASLAADPGSAVRADSAQAPSRPAASRAQRRQAKSTAARRGSNEAQVARAPVRKSRRVVSAAQRARTSASRLQLERSTPQAAGPATAAVASAPLAADVAASAAAMVAAAASAASEAERISEAQREQIAELQRRLDQSRLDTQVSNAAAAKLQARLEAAEATRYSLPWLVALTVSIAVLLFGVGVLLDQRRLARRPRRPTWSVERAQTRPAPSTLTPAPSSTMAAPRATAQWADDARDDALASTTGPLPFSRAATPATAPAAPAPSRPPVAAPPFSDTAVLAGARTRAEPVRSALPVTADALIDLEQQAEFFVALGQEDTAVDLLDGFSRGAGGACPMPYLMLLDIHRRRGDRDAHAAVRERYEKRFNRVSPAWDDQPAVATSMADHAQEMRRIESVWNDPPAAMRLVESLLVHGGTPAEAFDLHCLSELRFLYLLARDHSDIEPPPVEPVDLLLPLSPLTSAKPVGTAVDLELDFLPPASTPSKPL